MNTDIIDPQVNYEISLINREGRVVKHHAAHNIVVNTGRQFMAETITASAFAGSNITRTNTKVIRYVGFGIGGARQTSALANSPPLSTNYPGTNLQRDDDPTVSILERPVGGPYLREVSTPGTFPTATSTRYIATFAETDINNPLIPQVPLSEIGLYTSDADPALPNGSAAAYPGAGGELFAYDTFPPITKTELFSIQVRWEIRF